MTSLDLPEPGQVWRRADRENSLFDVLIVAVDDDTEEALILYDDALDDAYEVMISLKHLRHLYVRIV